MILVTGASGKSGRAVIMAIAARGEAVRALVRKADQSELVIAAGAHEVFVGDLRDPAAMKNAMQGVEGIYLICPNVQSDELAIAKNVIKAAQSANIERFVYHSVHHPHTERMPHHWQKLRVEEQLFESGLNYTILQPTAYMQNVLANWEQIKESGIYTVPYSADVKFSMVDLLDVAAVAATVLTVSGHNGAIYELVGPDTLNLLEIANLFSHYLNQPVRVEVQSLEIWERQARQAGQGGYPLETLLKMFRYYDQFGLWGNSNVLGWLLGRPATCFADFAERTVREHNQSS